MSQELFTVTVFLAVSSLAWAQYIEIARPEPNHCQLRPDRRRCEPTFLPRWYFNPVKGNCFLFKYGGCHGNRNNFLSQEECLEKCSPPTPRNALSSGVEDEMIEAYVERCKAPADTGPCRARMNKWYYDAGKRRCFPFIYGGCSGNSNKYDTENECMLKCATSDRVPSSYSRSGPRSVNPNFRERSLMGRSPPRRTIRNPERRGAFFRTFFPLIWQVNVPNTPEPESMIPGSPRPEDLEAMKTTTVGTTPAKVEVTQEPTTQPPKMETTNVNSILASTTPPTRLEEEEINRVDNNDNAIRGEVDSRDYEEDESSESMEEERNINEEDQDNMERDNEETSVEEENEEPEWKSNEEEVDEEDVREPQEYDQEDDKENDQENKIEEKDVREPQDYYQENDQENKIENEEVRDMDAEPKEANNDYDYDNTEEEEKEEETDESIEKQSEENEVEDQVEEETESKEQEGENEGDEKDDKLDRPRGPIIRFLFRTPSRLARPFNRRMNRPGRPTAFRRPDYRKYYGPHDMSSGGRYENMRRFPAFNRQRNYRNWRDRNNRTPKRGISLTQVFVNKPPHPPMVNRHPLMPVPLHPYPVSPFHGPVIYRLPGFGYSRSLSIQGRQIPGSPPQLTGTYQSTRWPSSELESRFKVNFVPKIGEPNLACIQPPAVYRCIFGIPSTTPFWYFDARLGKCSVFYFAGCGATLNRFNTRLECEGTCMVTSPMPEITTTTTTEESVEQATESSTESFEVTDDNKSTELKTEVASIAVPAIKPESVKETMVEIDGNDESETVGGTIELSKTHKIHILHQLTDKEKLLVSDKDTNLEYIMVVGIVCLSGIALLILVSLGLMYMFKRFQNASPAKTLPVPKKETVIEAVLKSHMQVNGLPKIICPVPLGPPQNTSL